MPKLQGRLAVILFAFVMLAVLGAGLAAAAEPPQGSTPAPTKIEMNPVPLWLGGIGEACYDPNNGCQPPYVASCCWRCPGGTSHWTCSNTSSESACKSLCTSSCHTTCGLI